MNRPELEHVIVPLVSPFTDDTLNLSEVRFARLVAFHRERGSSGFLVASEAGEGYALGLGERKQLTEWAMREAKGMPVFVDLTASTTAAVIDLAQHAERHGALGGVLTMPRDVRLTAEEQTAFLSSVHRYANLPCTILDATEDSGDQQARGAKTLAQGEWSSYGLGDPVSAEEFTVTGGVSTPYGVFGAKTLAQLASKPPEVFALAHALLQRYRSHRVGKAWVMMQGLEIGHTRGPVRDLDAQGMSALERLASYL